MKEGSKQQFWLGLDLGGTKMFAVVFDGKMNVKGQSRQKTGGQKGPAEGVPRMLAVMEEALAAAGVEAGKLGGIGVGCPGVVDWKAGVLVDAPNLGWKGVPVARPVADRFGVPVSVLNDVDAGTLGEFWRGAGRGAGTLLGVFPGTGLGAGCVVDGRLLRHRRFSCMELGRMRVPSTALVGNEGGLIPVETTCSRLAIAAAAAVEAFRGNAPHLLEQAGTDIQRIKSKALARAYAANDPGVRHVFDRAVDYLALAVGAAVEILGPDRLVLGGGLFEAMPGLAEPLRRRLAAYVTPELLKELTVKVAELGDFAVALGSASAAAEAAGIQAGGTA